MAVNVLGRSASMHMYIQYGFQMWLHQVIKHYRLTENLNQLFRLVQLQFTCD